jgi:hypothetical protein
MKNSSLLHALAAFPIGKISLHQMKKWHSVTCSKEYKMATARHRSTIFQPVVSYQLHFSCGLFNNPADIDDVIALNDTVPKEW